MLLLYIFPFCRSNPLSLSAKYWTVYSGVVSLDRLPQPYLVEKIILNEDYNNKTNDLDVALLKLKSPVVFSGQSLTFMLLFMFFVFFYKKGDLISKDLNIILSSCSEELYIHKCVY